MKNLFVLFSLFLGMFNLSGKEIDLGKLHAARGTIYRVNLQERSFEFLTQTEYDPKTDEGRSRYKVYWKKSTKFSLYDTRQSFSGLEGSFLADIVLSSADLKLVSDGKDFSARFINLYRNTQVPKGLNTERKRLSCKFTAIDKKTGFVEFNGQKFKVRLSRKVKVTLFTDVYENILNEGLFSGRIFGRAVNGRFELGSVQVSALPDPRKLDNPDLPRVLVIGDSISMNYHDAAKKALKGKANYYRIDGNGGPSTRGIQNIELWLGDYQQKGFHWDVIQFNFGLHDLLQSYDVEQKSYGAHKVSTEVYKQNLLKVISLLKQTNASLIWCSTTPVPNNSGSSYGGRRKGASQTYNNAALEVMSKYPEIGLTDLYSIVQKDSTFDQWKTGTNVHFKEQEQVVLGQAVAAAVMKALKSRK